MALATIKAKSNGDLFVTRDGHEWRRVSGTWEMRGNSGDWFACEIQDRLTRNQVADFECCLRSYEFAEGPDYPRGRRRGEDVGAFIRRTQLAELRKDAKNIFARVSMKYTPGAAFVAERTAHIRKLSSPMPWRNDRYILAAYDAAMYDKRVVRSLAPPPY